MKNSLFLLLILISTPTYTKECSSNDISSPSTSNDKYKITSITIISNPIFTDEEADTWLYRLGNSIHINTKEYVVQQTLPFKVGDTISLELIAETERILRTKRYLRDAEVFYEFDCVDDKSIEIIINTWDNWSLKPTADFGRKAGENSYTIGIEDDNFLGLGIGSSIEYNSDPFRSGYRFQVSSELFEEEHIFSSITYANNSDGKERAFSLIRPFYTLNSTWASAFNISNTEQIDTIYQNDLIVNEFDHQIKNIEFKYGFSKGVVNNQIWRYWFGINFKEDLFNPNQNSILVPTNRKLTYPFVAFEYNENNFIIEENVFLIDTKEDIQLGYQYQAKVGVDIDKLNSSNSIIWEFSAQHTAVINKNLFFHYWFKGNGIESSQQNLKTSKLSLGYQTVYKLNNEHSSWSTLVFNSVRNAYIDKPNSLGGDSLLRGFPLQYQHGKNTLLFSFEQRYNPHVDVFHLANLGFVGFVDIGKAYGKSDYTNLENGYLASVGLGARFFLSRASGKKIVNLEIIKPIVSEFQSDIEFRVSVTSYF